MQVKLIKDFERNGRVKVKARPGRAPIAYYAGTEVSVSDLTGKKWIEQGIAVPVLQPDPVPEGKIKQMPEPVKPTAGAQTIAKTKK